MSRDKRDPEGVDPPPDGTDKHFFPSRVLAGHICSPLCERCKQDQRAKGNPEGVDR